MRILIACEESQAVCTEMRRLGHEAYSCDIQECSGGHPEWHLQVDALELLKLKWDMIIAHPPCTYMTNAGAVRMRVGGQIVEERLAKAMEAKAFFMAFYNADCPRIAIENPTPMKLIGLPDYDQAIQPYWFGHPYSKRTCLWLKGLPPLMPPRCWRSMSRMSMAGVKMLMGITGSFKAGKSETRKQEARPSPESPGQWRSSGRGRRRGW